MPVLAVRLTLAIAMMATAAAFASAEANQSEPAEGNWVTEVHVGKSQPKAAVTTASIDRNIRSSHALDGIASFYWQGQMTASGEAFDKRAMTAAHPSLPFGTLVEVTNLGNGRKTVVRINDRGPFKPGRVIDVSEAAAEILDMQKRGLAPVKLVVVSASGSH
jgi:rare lipoprotein A